MDKRLGYTTGTYAVAAAKGALAMLLGGRDLTETVVTLPNGEKAVIPLRLNEKTVDYVQCAVMKRSVEETDVTHNMEILARVSLREDDRIIIEGGPGIGRITKKGLQLPVGEAAINPVPRKMICSSMRGLTSRGVDVMISAPGGEEVAALTCNQRLGIIGGISIIGTTGIMRPKSLPSFKKTILQQLNFCMENGIKEIVITPGNISEDAMLMHFGERVSKDRIVQAGDFLGFTLSHAYRIGLTFVLAGHPGKLGKVLGGYFQTHYSSSPPANAGVIKLVQDRISDDVLKEMEESPTVEGITAILMERHYGSMLNDIAEVIEEKVKRYLKTESGVPVLLFNMKKDLIGASKTGMTWIKR
jgi:cobalt-precorrin-5B (C1)-methyltransferase